MNNSHNIKNSLPNDPNILILAIYYDSQDLITEQGPISQEQIRKLLYIYNEQLLFNYD